MIAECNTRVSEEAEQNLFLKLGGWCFVLFCFSLNLTCTHVFKCWLHVLINRIFKQKHMKENFSDKSEQNNRTILKFGLKINFEELFLFVFCYPHLKQMCCSCLSVEELLFPLYS